MTSRLPAWLLLFGLMLAALAAGAWLGMTSAKGLYATYLSHAWQATPCKVVSSEAKQTTGRVANSAWYVRAACAYQARGQTHTIDCSPHLTGSKELVDGQMAALQVDSEHMCYVNPNDPAEAVFDENQGYLLPAIFLAVAALFVALGCSGAVMLIRNGLS